MDSRAYEVPDAIQWYEGMLLAPQHFQQFARRHEALLQYHAGRMSPFHWGVRFLEIDRVLLVDGRFRVQEVEAIMPDGLIVHFDRKQAYDLEIGLTSHVDEMKEKPVEIHLAVPALRLHGASSDGELARYESLEGAAVADDNTGEGALQIPRIRPRLTLLLTDTPPNKYVSLPIAKVEFKNETFVLSEFVPPLLHVTPDTPVGRLCVGISRRIREKVAYLAEQVNSPSLAVGSPQAQDLRAKLQKMVEVLPYFEAVVNTGASHPYTLYLALCTLAGHLGALREGLVPPVWDPYDHRDISRSFKQVAAFVDKVLAEGIRESHIVVPFSFANGAFSVVIDKEWLDGPLTIGARARAGSTERDVADYVVSSLIGSESVVPSLRSKRIQGVERRMIEQDGDLVPVRGEVLFALEVGEAFVKPDEPLIIVSSDPQAARARPAEILLYVLNTQTSDRASKR